MRYRGGGAVTDILIREVPPEVVAAVDAHAARLGLSRTEYLRRRLVQEAVTPLRPVTTHDLEIFAAQFSELADPDIMRAAWE
jgi:hypothetical protein